MKRTVHRPVRITPYEEELLKRVADERDTSVSSVIRWAIRVALSADAGGTPAVGMKRDGAEVLQATGTAL